ncbi:MLO-like protein 10 [Apium graveolens]|uniref:MLO-like protein 10 n=1 Tax=Apium graveolens TaxID=4045 RepID=UPI003D7B0364
MAGYSSGKQRELDQTPTWAVAGFCAAFIIISILLEKILHKLGAWFTKKHKKALFDALDKVKSELMILGFISLILTFTQYYIAEICVPEDVANSMLPCPRNTGIKKKLSRLLEEEEAKPPPKDSKFSCKEGKVPLISKDGLHQLHILIFFLAVLHVIYSAITMALGKLKIRGWKVWEKETASNDYEFANDASRFRLVHETSFVRAHTKLWTKIPFVFTIGCFLRQFFRSVTKTDYLTLRNGFINVHLAPGSKFDFQKYIKRSLEDDFKVVVGVSPVLWASFVIFLLINVDGSEALFWVSLIPLVIILAVGTKLQSILTKMATEIINRHAVVQGIPLVQGSDKYFWFGRPKLVLYLIHFALFQNAFQVTYFLWITYEFGVNSCFHENYEFLIVKLCIGVLVLVLCSYITLPLYALVTQMGSHMKKSIFDEQTSRALLNWKKAAKKHAGRAGESTTTTMHRGRTEESARRSFEDADPIPIAPVASASVSNIHSSPATLHRFKTTGHSSYDEYKMSVLEVDHLAESATARLIVRVDNGNTDVEKTVLQPNEELQ